MLIPKWTSDIARNARVSTRTALLISRTTSVFLRSDGLLLVSAVEILQQIVSHDADGFHFSEGLAGRDPSESSRRSCGSFVAKGWLSLVDFVASVAGPLMQLLAKPWVRLRIRVGIHAMLESRRCRRWQQDSSVAG